MIIGILKEPDFDKRVALLPENVKTLVDLNMASPEHAGQLKNIIQRAIHVSDPKKQIE